MVGGGGVGVWGCGLIITIINKGTAFYCAEYPYKLYSRFQLTWNIQFGIKTKDCIILYSTANHTKAYGILMVQKRFLTFLFAPVFIVSCKSLYILVCQNSYASKPDVHDCTTCRSFERTVYLVRCTVMQLTQGTTSVQLKQIPVS